MKYLVILALPLILITSCIPKKITVTPEPPVAEIPLDTAAIVKSILNTQYDRTRYPTTYKELQRWDSCVARQVDSCVQAMLNLPATWPKKTGYLVVMETFTYQQLPGLARQAHDEYQIDKLNPQDDPDLPVIIEPNFNRYNNGSMLEKPVIYLYPAHNQQVTVHLDIKSPNLYTWPRISDSQVWNVQATPDGTLTDTDGEQYPYLFWEASMNINRYTNLHEGFTVDAEDTESFLREKLKFLGLNAREHTDFITYWAPRMRKNSINFVRFETTAYAKDVPLNITPAPDCIQRILMVFMPVEKTYICTSQDLTPFQRKGFTVIEWGGAEVREMKLGTRD